jgi:hypothetical protein
MSGVLNLPAHNPGLTLEQISDAIIPRLGRPVYVSGKRDRISALLSFEYRPADTLSFYLDTLYAKAHRDYNRIDVDLVGRSGGIIPLNLQVDSNDVVTQGTFANAQYFLEARPYKEYINYYNLNPGMHCQPLSWIGVDFQLNRSVRTYYRDTPTILINTPLGQGITVNYVNNGDVPSSSNANVNLNDPNAGWTWAGGRVNVSDEHRDTETKGWHLDLQFGNDPISVKVGGAFDEALRKIIGLDNSAAWQQAVCGGGGTYNPAASQQPACTGGAAQTGPWQNLITDYDKFLPALNLTYNLASDIVTRFQPRVP